MGHRAMVGRESRVRAMGVWTDEIVSASRPWGEGQLWFSDWGAGRIWSVAAGAEPPSRPRSSSRRAIDFLPDGRLLVVSPADGGVPAAART